jgi:DNA polymerase
MPRHILHRDIETRSTFELTEVGAWRYAAEPTTGVWSIGYAVDNPPQIWTPDQPIPEVFFIAARDPDWLIVAHNDAFEQAIEERILAPRYGWPLVPLERHRCTMAMALACALPGGLDGAAEALNSPFPKDVDGQRLMRKMARPRKPRAGEDPNGGPYWHDEPENQARLQKYCMRDIEAERWLYQHLPLLIDSEQALWALDQQINQRGFYTDGALLNAAHHVVTETGAALQTEFRELTGLNSTNQTAKLIAWLAEHNCTVTDVQKGTLRHALRRKGLEPAARRAIELRLQLAHASAGKVEALLTWRDADDGRVRGTLKFHGAGTGRWAGHGPQPQNFKRDAEGTDEKIAAIMNVGEGLASPVEAVGEIARAMICAAPGHRLLIGDYGAIESRITAWAAGEQSKIDLWKRFDQTGDPNDDPYVVFGRAIKHPETSARAYGKVGDLAFGFGGGVGAWQNFAPEDDTSDEATIKRYRDTWRARHPKTVQFWYALDRAAISAIRNPSTDHRVGRFTYRFDAPFLRVKLPSGRSISYPFAEIMPQPDRFGHPRATFLDTAGGGFGPCNFGRGSWGGTWCENTVSGVARDLLAAAMLRLEGAGYHIVLHVHDEIVAEVPENFGSLEEFQRLITTLPDWAEGLPIAAKVRAGLRFSKPEQPQAPASADPDVTISDDLRIPNFLLRCPAPPMTAAVNEEIDANARCTVGNARRTVNTSVPDGNGPHHQVHNEDTARLAMAGQVSSAPENGIGTARGSNLGSAGNGKIICPFHDDHDPSLQLYADGHYHCYVCGAHGDIEELPDATPAPASNTAQSNVDTFKRGTQLWQTAVSIRGTLAEQYLTVTRKLDLAILPDIDAVLRFHPRCPFDGNSHPCVIALFRDVETDEVAGIHRIALTAKAEKIGRMMLGSWPRPRAIKLRSGGDKLIVGEGIETTIAGGTQRNSTGAVWAVGSANAIAQLPVIASIAELTILIDHDDNDVGPRSARACSTHWSDAGRTVILLTPRQIGADFNDLIKPRAP